MSAFIFFFKVCVFVISFWFMISNNAMIFYDYFQHFNIWFAVSILILFLGFFAYTCIYMERKNKLHIILMNLHYKCYFEDPGKNMSSTSPYMCRKRRLNGAIMWMNWKNRGSVSQQVWHDKGPQSTDHRLKVLQTFTGNGDVSIKISNGT
jgi:hypothetical protein